MPLIFANFANTKCTMLIYSKASLFQISKGAQRMEDANTRSHATRHGDTVAATAQQKRKEKNSVITSPNGMRQSFFLISYSTLLVLESKLCSVCQIFCELVSICCYRKVHVYILDRANERSWVLELMRSKRASFYWIMYIVMLSILCKYCKCKYTVTVLTATNYRHG